DPSLLQSGSSRSAGPSDPTRGSELLARASVRDPCARRTHDPRQTLVEAQRTDPEQACPVLQLPELVDPFPTGAVAQRTHQTRQLQAAPIEPPRVSVPARSSLLLQHPLLRVLSRRFAGCQLRNRLSQS